jgi:hypothetical protein
MTMTRLRLRRTRQLMAAAVTGIALVCLAFNVSVSHVDRQRHI